MPAGKSVKGAPDADPASGGDRIGALPDEILHRVLSFLPAQQAVRTCVLARRWLHLWKSATGLRIVGADGTAPAPFEVVREFVDNLLLLRGSTPLEKLELRVAGAAVDLRRIWLWVKYAVMCNVQMLRLYVLGQVRAVLRREDPPLASRHLTKLELRCLVFNHDFLDFSRCPALRYLLIADCVLMRTECISSQSLKNLCITRGIFNKNSRTRIQVPNLASLALQVNAGRTPVIEKMPLLVWASIGIFENCADCCSHSNDWGCGNESCGGCIQDDKSPVLLSGI